MKRCAYSLSLLILTLQGCASIDPSEFFRNKKYESDKPFRMKGANLDAPLLSHKGESEFELNVANGISAHAAVAITPRFGALLNGSLVNGDNVTTGTATVMVTYLDGYTEYQTGSYELRNDLSERSLTAGLIHFRPFGRSGRSEQILGLAWGNSECKYEYVAPFEGESSSGNNFSFTETRKWMQYFIQQNVGWVTPRTEGGLLLRLSYMKFHDQEFWESYPVENYAMQNSQWLFQPGLKLGVGWEKVRFFLQCNFNLAMSGDVHWYGTQWKSGMTFRFGPQR